MYTNISFNNTQSTYVNIYIGANKHIVLPCQWIDLNVPMAIQNW